jgi:hypothetical protein
MNLLLTNYCNKRCPYCFADEKLAPAGSPQSRAMSLKDLKTAIAFLKRSNESHVNIMGGEPTLHPEFKKAISMVVKSGLSITLFTNGLMSRDTAVFLKSLGDRCWLVLNINSPESHTPKEWAAVNRTLKVFSNNRICLGFTVYRTDFSLDFAVGLIRKYGLSPLIRVGIAAPVVGGRNAYMKTADHPRVAEKLARFAERHGSSGIKLGFDCGFTMCDFTDAQLGKLFRSGSSAASLCLSCIDVGPDLRMWRCFSTALLWNKQLSDFPDLASAIGFYDAKFRGFRNAGLKKGCLACGLRLTGRCAGGCLGHILRGFDMGACKPSARPPRLSH